MEKEPEHMTREQGEGLGPGARGQGVGVPGAAEPGLTPGSHVPLPLPPVPEASSDPASPP